MNENLLALREKFIAMQKPFPVKYAIAMYLKSPTKLYSNYFEDFLLLVEWLAPIEAIPQDYAQTALPRILMSYEILQLSIIFRTTPQTIYTLLTEILNDSEH